ncbi:hypothetical protein BASA60_003251 [Batrachochytrium salamandrivorans]|nr:hypothetical protein BASA60_003251 [Batrachochytrium salamandrivorans]
MGLSSTPRRQHTPKKELSESHSQTPDTTMNTSKRNMLWSDSLTPICSRKTMGIVVSMLATTVVANFFMNLQTPITLLDIGIAIYNPPPLDYKRWHSTRQPPQLPAKCKKTAVSKNKKDNLQSQRQ